VRPSATDPLPNGYRHAVLEFRILGPLEVLRPEGPVHLGGPKQRATLAILLLNANRVVSIDRLADDLYAGRAPVTAATQVHRQISELRKGLGPDARIDTRAPGYVKVRRSTVRLCRNDPRGLPTPRADELADRLEQAITDDVKLLALTIDERAIILNTLDDPPKELAELRAVLLNGHQWREARGL
jgi:hypothetical protein